MKMKTIAGLISLALFIVAIFLFVRVVNDANTVGKETEERMKVHVGKSVAMHRDTLMIVDYSMVLNMYKLENGTWVNSDLVDKIEIK